MARMLLVEDNDYNVYLTRFLLEHRGHELDVARSGEEGLSLAQKGGHELVLLDIQLPDVNGFIVASRLREIETLSNTPIVAVTSFAMPGDRQRALDAGFNGYIEKPINPETFASEVERHLVADSGS